ncbi:hypothetical protein ACFP1I_22365 [Dyadobacter subterraneus]|uniref:Uncharacterized protein n=1 Tax=Dyadobacter subterraneus TaxID=2773304 RepID=A0ABR9WK35_9BACT|nr:hypothetical protein [Dyadobacter subterraneus]MBE9465489.1 hypothetical protein [Dyadobacter subterraneus]
MSMFSIFETEKISIINKKGSSNSDEFSATLSPKRNLFSFENLPESLIIEKGDKVKRILPNGQNETYVVLDFNYTAAFMSIPGTYELAVSKI